MSAVLVPYTGAGAIDWAALEAHLGRTAEAGLVPAVNMDTGYVQLLTPAQRVAVLDLAQSVCGAQFVAGTYVADVEGSAFHLDGYLKAVEQVAGRGATPVIFPSWGLTGAGDAGWVEGHAAIAARVDRLIAFELGPMFVPYGRIVSLDTYRDLLALPQCVGAKHSSLDRGLEWQRLGLRDALRPEFLVLTGNDLAIDMVMWGSDYLLGLSTFAPDLFARRDRLWAAGDPRFFEVNDLLQYLGQFAFRPPVPAYRHDAAMFLQLRGWAESDVTPPGAPRRPEGDRAVLADIAERLEALA